MRVKASVPSTRGDLLRERLEQTLEGELARVVVGDAGENVVGEGGDAGIRFRHVVAQDYARSSTSSRRRRPDPRRASRCAALRRERSLHLGSQRLEVREQFVLLGFG